MELIIYLIISFLILYLISYFLLVRKANKYSKKKVPLEVQYLIRVYNIDVGKMNYKKFVNQISIIGSLDMTLAVFIIYFINSVVIQLLVGFFCLIPIIYLSFFVYGKYLVKKGYVKNERRRNRK